ncbi:Histone-lysine N-methyltransferase, H3 lysine-9 specific SUVH4 [Ananas comosus]|uniref:Histone-lysine N-methyltransferase, H3 lysine-9 specific SUVH4 n=1 Tax=Ananas comosus TaxID=4615 RepID=A0A199UJ24_ANACO|nr:Histone-lysine N-methyltransferase, H3 lysine-9 specific SUVH4 [Ananas comosus]
MVGDAEARNPIAVVNSPPVVVLVSSPENAPPAENAAPAESPRWRRRSLRYAGKERPNYADTVKAKEDFEEGSSVRRKYTKRKRRETAANKLPDEKRTMAGNDADTAVAVRASEPTAIANSGVETRVVGNGHCKENAVAGVERMGEEGGGCSGCGAGEPSNGVVKSAKTRVKETLRAFNSHYLHFVQEEQRRAKELEEAMALKAKENGGRVERVKKPSKRPDLKAISKAYDPEQYRAVSREKGWPPSRFVLMLGIDSFRELKWWFLVCIAIGSTELIIWVWSLAKRRSTGIINSQLATCVVLSGMYEDDLDNCEEIVYTGQGGHDLLGNKKQIGDQKMERGNLALKNNMDSDAPVRVVRGHVLKSSYCGRVYTYDGLYKVIKYWPDKGVSGFTVFKYKLKRLEGQASLTTSQVRFTRGEVPKSISDLRGYEMLLVYPGPSASDQTSRSTDRKVSDDISGGQEKFPIPATNTVDEPPVAPSGKLGLNCVDFENDVGTCWYRGFIYCNSLQIPSNMKVPENVAGCNCEGDCSDPRICDCAKLNGSDFPYVFTKDGGRLVEAKSMVFECGANCGCSINCINRTSQQGLKYRLEVVFRTPKKGWGVRSWDTIPPGAPVCEYTGILRRSDEADSALENNYIFEIDCVETLKGVDGREKRAGDWSFLVNPEDKNAEVPEYCIDASPVGNIARFINHSCQPNLFVQCVLSSHRDFKMAKVMLFAADTIPPDGGAHL